MELSPDKSFWFQGLIWLEKQKTKKAWIKQINILPVQTEMARILMNIKSFLVISFIPSLQLFQQGKPQMFQRSPSKSLPALQPWDQLEVGNKCQTNKMYWFLNLSIVQILNRAWHTVLMLRTYFKLQKWIWFF